MISKEVKKIARKYALAVAWLLIHEEDKRMEKKVAQVIDRVGELEQELLDEGVSRLNIDKILQRAKKFVKKSVGEMTDRQLETMCKLIFGQKTELETFDRRELNRPGVLCFDPIKYARWKRKEKEKA